MFPWNEYKNVSRHYSLRVASKFMCNEVALGNSGKVSLSPWVQHKETSQVSGWNVYCVAERAADSHVLC